jgi:hypothetical protein
MEEELAELGRELELERELGPGLLWQEVGWGV